MRVLDLTWVLGGPFAGQLLAQLGAEVIKVETHEGDSSRTIPPHFFEGDSAFFLSVNRGKRSVSLNLKHPDGRQAFYDLVAASDVVIYGFAPDVPKRLGIDYESLRLINPEIRVGELIGLHDEGEYMRAPAYDIVVQAMSGIMDITGDKDGPPSRVGYQIADLAGGMYLAMGVCAALVGRPGDDGPKHVQVSLLDCQLALLTWQAQNYFVSGREPTRLGSRSPNIAPSEAFEGSDGRHLTVSPTGTAFWEQFCVALGEPELVDDPRFRTRLGRLENVEELAQIIQSLLKDKPAGEWAQYFFERRIPAAQVLRVSEALEQPLAKERSMVETVEHPRTGNTLNFLGNPFKYAGSRSLGYPSAAGADTRDVLSKICGYSAQRITELDETGAIMLGGDHDLAH
jgi:CoA:oxalate CoA-transferase